MIKTFLVVDRLRVIDGDNLSMAIWNYVFLHAPWMILACNIYLLWFCWDYFGVNLFESSHGLGVKMPTLVAQWICEWILQHPWILSSEQLNVFVAHDIAMITDRFTGTCSRLNRNTAWNTNETPNKQVAILIPHNPFGILNLNASTQMRSFLKKIMSSHRKSHTNCVDLFWEKVSHSS